MGTELFSPLFFYKYLFIIFRKQEISSPKTHLGKTHKYMCSTGGSDVDIENIMKLWPIFLAFITLVIVLAKADNRLSVLEEKVRALFDLMNKK